MAQWQRLAGPCPTFDLILSVLACLQLLNSTLQLTKNCLSFDFIGTSSDDCTDDLRVVQIPSCTPACCLRAVRLLACCTLACVLLPRPGFILTLL